MSQAPWDYIAKLVCIGDSGTGKSSLTIRLCEGRFSAHHDVTIGVEFGSRIVPVGPPASLSLPSFSSFASTSKPNLFPPPPTTTTSNKSSASSSQQPQKHMKLSLWDTAGQETYASVTRSYFRGASGALLVFSLTRRSSFEAATRWLADLRQIADGEIVVVLVGNKLDLVEAAEDGDGDGGAGRGQKREVDTAEAQAWCEKNGVLRYVETSAKSGEGVEIAFREVAERIYGNVLRGKYDLNDRRSGVKGPGTIGSGGVRLGVRGEQQGRGRAKSGWSSGCC